MMVLVQERRATTTRPLPTARLASAGLIRDLLGDPPTAMLHLARKYGPVVQIKVGSKRYILLSDPDDIREVLVVNPQRFHRAEGARRLQRFLGDGLLMAEGGRAHPAAAGRAADLSSSDGASLRADDGGLCRADGSALA